MPKNVLGFFGGGSRKAEANLAVQPESTQSDSGWSKWVTEEGDAYYYNSITGESSWERPAEMKSADYEWEEHYTEEGDVYYYNTVTQSSQWEYPYEQPEVPQQSEPYDDLEWMEYTTEDGYPYFYNVYTEEVQWENPYASYDDYSYDQQYNKPNPEPEPLYATESSTDRHLEIWSKFFENAFAAQEWMEEERERNRSKAANRAAKAAKLAAVVNQWPSRMNEKKFRAQMSSVLTNRSSDDGLFGDDEDLNEALLLAVTQEDYSSAESLLFAGANPNCTDQCIRSAAHYSAKTGNAEMMALLFDQGADLEMVDQVGRTPLHIAALFGREAVAEFLLACAVDVDGPVDHSGNTPLHLSARGGHASIVRLLLQFGASAKVNNSGGMTALEIAQTMQPQTSELMAVATAFKQHRKNKKKQSKGDEGFSSSPVKSSKSASNKYREMHTDWYSDADSPIKERTPTRTSRSERADPPSTNSTRYDTTSLPLDREWKIARSKSSGNSGGGLSDHLLSGMKEAVGRRMDGVLTRLLAKLPPMSPMAAIIYSADMTDQADYRVKLKPFLIEESVSFPGKCPFEVEQLLENARAQNNAGHCEDSLRLLESATKKSLKLSSGGSLDLEMYITLCKGNVYQSCGDDEQSLLTYMEGWTKAAAKNDLDWEVIAINAIGILAYYNLRFDVSLLCFHLVGNYRLDTYSEESVDTATAWNNEACCLYCLNKKGEARIKFERAWKAFSSSSSDGAQGDRAITAWKNLEKTRRNHSAGPSEASAEDKSRAAASLLRSESEGISVASSQLKLPSISGSSTQSSKAPSQSKRIW